MCRTFYGSEGSPRTPAFWLPGPGVWFTAEVEAPVWWNRFAMVAAGCDEWFGDPDEEADRCLPVNVPEEGHGKALPAEGPFFPDDTAGVDTWGRLDPWSGPRRFHGASGMSSYGDDPYQWTMCPQCGAFGPEFCGYAEQLPCGCLNDREYHKVANGSDRRLLAAYRAAQLEQWHADDFTDPHATVLMPTVREARPSPDEGGQRLGGPPALTPTKRWPGPGASAEGRGTGRAGRCRDRSRPSVPALMRDVRVRPSGQ